MQSAACQQEADECTSTGGTFGVINNENVCFPPGENNPPPCASGASQFVTNADGSTSPSCVGAPNIGDGNIANAPVTAGNNTPDTPAGKSAADTANNTAAIARINNDGFQAVVNAVNTLKGEVKNGGGGGGTGSSSTAEQDQSNTAGIVQAINEFKSQEKGADKCDPKNDDYAKCSGMTEEGADEGALRDGATTSGTGSLDAARDEILSAIENRPEVEVPEELAGLFLDNLPDSTSCTNLSFSWRGHSFQIQCDDTEDVRKWAAWVFALLTIWHCMQVVFTPRGA